MKERPILFQGAMVRALLSGTKTQTRRIVKGAVGGPCPYGRPGDRLWVRESWNVAGLNYGKKPRDTMGSSPSAWRYAADDSTGWQHGWRPSIHMPRWASRLTLEITGIRSERLQDISEADAEAEGVDFLRHIPDADETLCARKLYEILWDSINAGSKAIRGEDGKPNPWVWVVEFRRVEA